MSELIELIKESGVVGAGGAGFPTHVKLSSKAEYVIVNAAECEPLIRVDQNLLYEYTKEFLDGLTIVIENVQAQQGFIAIKKKHTNIIEKLKGSLENYKNIQIYELDDFYPAGDEQITVKEVTGRIVPEGGIPLNVGCVVINVETVLNIFNATKGIPVIKTFVTITGEVEKPMTYSLPIGVSYKDILNFSNVRNIDDKIIIDGGPMMGKIITDFNDSITKTTKAIIVLDKNHSLAVKRMMSVEQRLKQGKTSCLQCFKCTDLCPRNLLGHDVIPHITMRTVNYGLKNFSNLMVAASCSECGACELYACPNDLSPRKINGLIKSELAKKGIKKDKKNNFESSSMWEYRKIPVKRLIQRLELTKYDIDAPIEEFIYEIKKVTIKLKQHVGSYATCVVENGQNINIGEVIGKIDNEKLGTNIHSSISGIVTYVDDEKVIIEAK